MSTLLQTLPIHLPLGTHLHHLTLVTPTNHLYRGTPLRHHLRGTHPQLVTLGTLLLVVTPHRELDCIIIVTFLVSS